MSDTEGTGSDSEEVLEFKCRKCPGKTFTAAEKDSHRQFHKQQKEKDGKRRPGPKSKTRTSSRIRDTSPDASEVTLFQPVIAPGASKTKPPAKRSRRSGKDEAAAPKKKTKSKKNYDDTLVGNWQNGTGA